jgi:hypothetical protein
MIGYTISYTRVGIKTVRLRKLQSDRRLGESGRRDLNPGPPEPHLKPYSNNVGTHCRFHSAACRVAPTRISGKPVFSGSISYRIGYSLVVLVMALAVVPARAQSTRTYAQIWFKNGAADLYRDSLGLRLEIGSSTDSRRHLTLRPPPLLALGIAVALDAPLPTKDTLPIGPFDGATWRCFAVAGCWVTITTPGLGSYFRPTPNLPPERVRDVKAAIVNALQGADVPSIVMDLR